MNMSLSDQLSYTINSHDSLNSTNTSIETENSDMCINDSVPLEIKLLNKMFCLQVMDVYKGDQCRDLMNYLRSFSSKLQTEQGASDISHIVDNDNCVKFFRSYVYIVTENCDDMLVNISQRQYLNFIKFVMSLWNMSDKFDSLCARMASHDIHICLIRLIGRIKVSPILLESKQIQLMVMSVLGILHNINSKLHYTRSKYREEHLVQYLMPLADLETTKEFIGLKTAALLLLAFLVNENENSVLNANDEHIIYILNILQQTLDSGDLYSTYYGYHSLEILTSLRHIASPDNNKRSLINNGVLHQIEMVLKLENNEDHQKEIVAALELLWSLSFSKECIQVLNDDNCDLKPLIEELSQGVHQSIVLSARGILWNIKAQRSISINNLILSDGRNVNPHGHVMISYQHSTQDVMVRIKDKLTLSGYNVWMDVDHMRGSFVDAMAEGIQHASVLLLGLCQAFKNSPHCRQEVKYAYTLGISLVPVMLEPGFCPDGWLGLMCATLIHTEFIDPIKFDNNMVQLQRQLGTLGKMSNKPLTNGDATDGPFSPKIGGPCILKCCLEEPLTLQAVTSTHQLNDNPLYSSCDILTSVMSDHSSALNRMSSLRLLSDMTQDEQPIFRVDSECPRQTNFAKEPILDCIFCSQNAHDASHSNASRHQVLDWTCEQCQMWLTKHSLDTERIGYPLSHLDGTLLLELAEMRLTAPESYFTAVKEELKLNFIDKLHLSRALRRLDELP